MVLVVLLAFLARPGVYYNSRPRVRLKEKSYIKIDIRKLDRVLNTKYLPYIHWANGLCYINPSLP